MKLAVPHNWQPDLVKMLGSVKPDEFYAKLESDAIGGGRASNICPQVSRSTVRSEVQKAQASGAKFNYLLNASCLDNRELSVSMHKHLANLFKWLKKIRVDAVTVSIPYLAGYIKKNYPGFSICVSTMAQVDTPAKARFWEGLGADKITLSEGVVNRNFELIKKIRQAVKCQLQLIANNGCLYDCQFVLHHGLAGSHASQAGHISSLLSIDFYRLMCTYMRMKDPVNYIRADWIRPEDVPLYEGLGIDFLKIVNRGMSSAAIAGIARAYAVQKYAGNLLDLLPSPAKNINFKKHNLGYLFKYFFHPGQVNIFKLLKMKEVFSQGEGAVYIDNKKLDGFLLSLQDKNCNLESCDRCNWCRIAADKAVKFDRLKMQGSLNMLEGFINELKNGKVFRYL